MCGAIVSSTSLHDTCEILFHVGVYGTVWRMAVYCFIGSVPVCRVNTGVSVK